MGDERWRNLGGRRRTLARMVYARDRSTPGYVCPVCSQPIDWSLPFTDPVTGAVNVWSKSVDHGEELQDGGDLTNLDNLFSAHYRCNSSKGAARRHERERAVKSQARAVPTISVDPTTL